MTADLTRRGVGPVRKLEIPWSFLDSPSHSPTPTKLSLGTRSAPSAASRPSCLHLRKVGSRPRSSAKAFTLTVSDIHIGIRKGKRNET